MSKLFDVSFQKWDDFIMRLFTTRLPVTIEFLIAFAIVLLARGSAIFGVVWAQDDFLQTYDSSGQSFIAVQTAMLRASVSLVTAIVTWLGATHPTNGSLWSGLHAGALVVFGLALRQLWIPGTASLYGIATALIFALFPGLNNHWQYQIVHPSMTIFYCVSAFALVSYAKGGWRTLLSILAISLALGYQIMLSLLLVASLIFLVVRLNHFIFTSKHEERVSLLDALAPVAGLIACLLAGTVLYYLTSKLAITLTGVGLSNRTNLAEVEDLPAKAFQLVSHLRQLAYGRGEPSIPANVKLVQSGLLASMLGLSGLAAHKSLRSWLGVMAYLLAVVFILLSAAISIRIPTIFFKYTAENSRVLMGTAVFWSGIFALSTTTGSQYLRRVGLILGAILFSAYAMITNSISSDFVRLNQRELLIGSRMVERLSTMPGFDRLRTIVIVGYKNQMLQDLRSTDQIWSSLNSAMATGLLREASGEVLANPSAADSELGRRASQTMTVWPLPGSTAIVGDVGVVVLSKSP